MPIPIGSSGEDARLASTERTTLRNRRRRGLKWRASARESGSAGASTLLDLDRSRSWSAFCGQFARPLVGIIPSANAKTVAPHVAVVPSQCRKNGPNNLPNALTSCTLEWRDVCGHACWVLSAVRRRRVPAATLALSKRKRTQTLAMMSLLQDTTDEHSNHGFPLSEQRLRHATMNSSAEERRRVIRKHDERTQSPVTPE